MADDRYITGDPLETLLRFNEELAELIVEAGKVQQAVIKELRFGTHGHHPERPYETNRREVLKGIETFLHEYQDVIRCVTEYTEIANRGLCFIPGGELDVKKRSGR